MVLSNTFSTCVSSFSTFMVRCPPNSCRKTRSTREGMKPRIRRLVRGVLTTASIVYLDCYCSLLMSPARHPGIREMAVIVVVAKLAVVRPVCCHRPLFGKLFGQDEEFVPNVSRDFLQVLPDLS